jgi:hypothetical protein
MHLKAARMDVKILFRERKTGRHIFYAKHTCSTYTCSQPWVFVFAVRKLSDCVAFIYMYEDDEVISEESVKQSSSFANGFHVK